MNDVYIHTITTPIPVTKDHVDRAIDRYRVLATNSIVWDIGVAVAITAAGVFGLFAGIGAICLVPAGIAQLASPLLTAAQAHRISNVGELFIDDLLERGILFPRSGLGQVGLALTCVAIVTVAKRILDHRSLVAWCEKQRLDLMTNAIGKTELRDAYDFNRSSAKMSVFPIVAGEAYADVLEPIKNNSDQLIGELSKAEADKDRLVVSLNAITWLPDALASDLKATLQQEQNWHAWPKISRELLRRVGLDPESRLRLVGPRAMAVADFANGGRSTRLLKFLPPELIGCFVGGIEPLVTAKELRALCQVSYGNRQAILTNQLARDCWQRGRLLAMEPLLIRNETELLGSLLAPRTRDSNTICLRTDPNSLLYAHFASPNEPPSYATIKPLYRQDGQYRSVVYERFFPARGINKLSSALYLLRPGAQQHDAVIHWRFRKTGTSRYVESQDVAQPIAIQPNTKLIMCSTPTAEVVFADERVLIANSLDNTWATCQLPGRWTDLKHKDGPRLSWFIVWMETGPTLLYLFDRERKGAILQPVSLPFVPVCLQVVDSEIRACSEGKVYEVLSERLLSPQAY